MPEILKVGTAVARKSHRCSDCGSVAVQPGETYGRTTLIYDGRAYDWIDCAECLALAPILWKWIAHPDEGLSAEDFAEWAHDHEDDPEHGVAARAYLQRARSAREVDGEGE